MKKVKVLGLGPAGSAFVKTYRHASGVDRNKFYHKACGEAVPVETPLVENRFVVDRVRRFKFFNWRRELGVVEYRRARWYILDKRNWVESMRENGTATEGEVVVKAGGPYQSVGEKITIVRAYVEGVKTELETAYFIYPPDAVGFYWVFPHGDVYNVGGGFIQVENPLPLVQTFVEKWLGGGRIIDVRGAPFTIKPRIILHDGEGFRIGEAAGLVYPLTGEGIRPGVLSAIALAEALSSRNPLVAYRKKIQNIIRQIEFQKRILELAQRLTTKGRQLIELVDDAVLRDYIEENLTPKTLFILMAKRPRVGVELVAALLKR
ncbi:MAG: NAD(P)/FAD-dependent oxidoreductase [Pyrobaculum sp.]